MAGDEAIALYGMVKKMAQAMSEREAALSAKTAALEAVVANLRQLPATVGKQTSQYIEKGVRASIREDIKWPVEEAFQKPIGELHYATNQARDVMREVRSAAKLQGWTAVAVMLLVGVALGMTSTYVFFIRDLGKINDRLETMQQQTLLPAPAPDTKPAAKPGKARQNH